MMRTSMQNYSALIKVLVFPYAWLKWMMMLGAALVLIGLPIHFFWGNPLCAIFGGILMSANIAMNSVTMPNQILSLNSSKQFGMLSGLRKKTGIIYFIFSVVVSISIALFVSLTNNANWAQLFLTVFVMASAFFTVGLLIAWRWSWAQGFLFFIYILLPSVFAWLLTLNPAVLLVSLIISWVVFFRWWLSWRPVKLHKSLLNMSFGDMKKNQQEFQLFLNKNAFEIMKSKPQTLIGTLLLGSADGWQARMKSVVSGLTVALLFLGLDKAFLDSRFMNVLIGQADLMFFMAYVLSSVTFQNLFFCNLYKLWMFYPESRYSFFSYLEKSFCAWVLVAIAPLVALHLTAPFFLSEIKNDLFFTIPLIMFAMALLAFSFYMSIVIYCKTLADDRWIKWIHTGTILFGSGIVIVASDHKTQLVPFMLAFMSLLFGSVVLLRHWVKKCWLDVDFMRVKN